MWWRESFPGKLDRFSCFHCAPLLVAFTSMSFFDISIFFFVLQQPLNFPFVSSFPQASINQEIMNSCWSFRFIFVNFNCFIESEERIFQLVCLGKSKHLRHAYWHSATQLIGLCFRGNSSPSPLVKGIDKSFLDEHNENNFEWNVNILKWWEVEEILFNLIFPLTTLRLWKF